MPNINIDDAYILDETGEQVDKVTGLFTKDEDTTSGEKAFAQLNIGTAGSNRNLLDNPFFTVNQRSATTVTQSNLYVADRWLVSGNGWSATNTGSGISFQQISGVGYLFQKMESSVYEFLNGKTVTYSVLIDGTVYSVTFTWDTTKRNTAIVIPSLPFAVFWYGDTNQPCLRFTVAGTYLVKAVKLELGSVSTLANDAPPDYGEELLKCLRYQWVVDTENVYGVVGDATVTTQNTEAMMVVHYPVPMYKVPTLSVSGAFRTVGGNGSAIVVGSVTSMTVTSNASNKNFARVTINGTTMGGTGTSVVVGANGAGAKLIFDANI